MKIIILGTGNLGTVLAERFFESGHQIVQIYSRDKEKAAHLANRVNSNYCDKIEEIGIDTDFYFLCVKDDAIETVANLLPLTDAIVVHCSGSTPVKVLEKHSNRGIFYPLQTFTVNIKPDFNELPVCITASENFVTEKLTELAKSICPNIYHVDEAQRKALHVAAVIVNNFSNFLFSTAVDICRESNMDFKILMPLIRQTIRKIENESPKNVQTGPAKRADFKTIESQLGWLEEKKPEFLEIYKILTKSIIDYYSNK